MTEPRRRPRVVGIDPSLTGTGIARSDGKLHTVGEKGVTTRSIPARTLAITSIAAKTVNACMMPSFALARDLRDPDLVVMELPSMGAAYGGNLERVGLFWEICRMFREVGVPVVAPTAGQRLKYLNGKGSNVGKNAVVEAVTRRYPDFETGGDDNLCDAIVYLAMGMDQYGHPIVEVPKTHRKVLAEIRNPDKTSAWPETI